MKVKFSQNHETATHKYEKGQTVDFTDEVARQLIGGGVATAIKQRGRPKNVENVPDQAADAASKPAPADE